MRKPDIDIFIDSKFYSYYEKHPLGLIDIGASGGMQEKWKDAQKFLQIIGFEPDEREFNNLSKRQSFKEIYIKTALYHEKTSIPFYLTKKQEVSSIFPPAQSFLKQFPEAGRFDVIGSVMLSADTLDSVVAEQAIKNIDFIKIDTQGSELSILRGADQLLKNNIFGIEVEVEFSSLYQGQPLFAEVDTYLRKHNFELFDLKRYYWKREIGDMSKNEKGQIIFADALYFKSWDGFKEILQGINLIEQKARVFKAISICIVYGYFDYALFICENAQLVNIIDNTEKELVFLKIKSQFTKPKIKFTGRIRNKLLCILNKIYKYLKFYDWNSSDEKIGN